jgi:tRNA acetyltransferase TAN1
MVLKNFNLLFSTPRHHEDDACSEMWFLLGEIGDEDSTVEKTHVSGLVVARTALNPFQVIEGLRSLLEEQPEELRYTLRVIPIEEVVKTEVEEIREACLKLSAKIGKNESFRVTVEKRYTSLSAKKIIELVAEDIDRKVDLQTPDKIVLIEILGAITGISVITPKDILSVNKEKP